MAEAPRLWSEACVAVRARIGEKNFEAWIAPLRCIWSDAAVALEAPDRRTRDSVARHFVGVLEEAVAGVAGHAYPVRVDLRTERPSPPIRTRPPSPAHTFASFVVGESNGRAFTAATSIANGTATLPLFVHGPSGVGKTHLLHAMCHALTGRGFMVACLPAAGLIDEIVAAVQADRQAGFWRGLEVLDALLLDDVHSLAGQEEMQENLIDGLVAFANGGRRLVVASDRPPDGIPELAARVHERFKRALIAHVAPPDPTLRLRLVEAKARLLGLGIDAVLARQLADAVGANVRRLEGALRNLSVHVRLRGRVADLALALEVLPQLRRAAPPTVERIVEVTARAFGVSPRQLRGRSRSAELLVPRRVAMYIVRKVLRVSYAAVGAELGRDHSTVLHACRAVEAEVASDAELARQVADIERRAARP